MAAPVSDRLGFDDPVESSRPNKLGNRMGLPSATPRAPAKLLPDQPIGIQPAQSPGQQPQNGGPRMPHFNLGASEALPGMGGDAAAGGAEAAGGAGLLAEAAPLLLA